MNISTIEQGEELLKKCSNSKMLELKGECGYPLILICHVKEDLSWYRLTPEEAKKLVFFWNHASELLQCAREVEERRKAMMFCSGPCNPSFTRAQIDVENNEAPVLSLDDYKRWT